MPTLLKIKEFLLYWHLFRRIVITDKRLFFYFINILALFIKAVIIRKPSISLFIWRLWFAKLWFDRITLVHQRRLIFLQFVNNCFLVRKNLFLLLSFYISLLIKYLKSFTSFIGMLLFFQDIELVFTRFKTKSMLLWFAENLFPRRCSLGQILFVRLWLSMNRTSLISEANIRPFVGQFLLRLSGRNEQSIIIKHDYNISICLKQKNL
jgi:hypothetical protein